jgi:hypothetical protein
VLGRALDRVVERDLDALLAGGADEALEVVQRAELRVHGGVAALLGADRPRAARVVRPGLERVVRPLAVRAADRMDRRQVEHVEAELGEARELRLDALEAAPGAREQLVPGAEARQRRVDVDVQRLRSRRLEPRPRLGGQRLLDGEALLLEQQRALRELAREVLLPALDLAPQLPLERPHRVDPRLDAVAPAAAGARREGRSPAVVAEVLHRRLAPAPRAERLRAERRAEHLVAVAEDRRLDAHLVVDARFHGVAAAVHERVDVLDLDAGGHAELDGRVDPPGTVNRAPWS